MKIRLSGIAFASLCLVALLASCDQRDLSLDKSKLSTQPVFDRPESLRASLHEYWANTLEDLDSSMRPPKVNWIAYTISSPELPRLCGGMIGPTSVYLRNAYYCHQTRSLIWDREIGDKDITVSLSEAIAVAHEYGHAIQSHYDVWFNFTSIHQSERQADCLAGMWATSTFAEHGATAIDLTLTSQDLLDAFSALFPPLPTSAQDERRFAFSEGFKKDIIRCVDAS